MMAAILLDRHLQSVANYLILSLAAADLLVAILVMPLGAVYEVIYHIIHHVSKSYHISYHILMYVFQISKNWMFGPILCDMWTSSDVFCCTASILHLLAIALDRLVT